MKRDGAADSAYSGGESAATLPGDASQSVVAKSVGGTLAPDESLSRGQPSEGKTLSPDASGSREFQALPQTVIIGNGPTGSVISSETSDAHILCGRFQVFGVLGGGMGTVYKCRDLQNADGGFLALKKVNDRLKEQPAEIARLRVTFNLVDSLQIPGIARMRDIFVDESTHTLYEVMAFVDGVDMRQWLAEHGGKASVREVLEICRQVSITLDRLHDAGVVHCDIKPSNIMIQAGKTALRTTIIDFGLAVELPKGGKANPRASGGTPRYMAPEQWSGGECTGALDQYSLAASMYEAFSGHVPFEAKNRVALGQAVLESCPPPLDECSWRINRALQRALRKEPARRYPTCTAFYNALTGIWPAWVKYSVAVVLIVGVSVGVSLVLSRDSGQARAVIAKVQLDGVLQKVAKIASDRDMRYMYGSEVALLEEAAKKLDRRYHVADYDGVRSGAQKLQKDMDTLSEKFSAMRQEQTQRLWRAQADLKARRNALNAQVFPTRVAELLQPHGQKMQLLEDRYSELQTVEDRERWLAECDNTRNALQTALRKETETHLGLAQTIADSAEKEKLFGLDEPLWTALKRRLAACQAAQGDESARLAAVVALAVDCEKALEACRRVKSGLEESYTRALDEAGALRKALDEAHVIMPLASSVATYEACRQKWSAGAWRDATEQAQAHVVRLQQLLKEYQTLQRQWNALCDEQKKGEKRYGEFLAEQWTAWNDDYKTAEKMLEKGEYGDLGKKIAELNRAFGELETQFQQNTARKRSALLEKWTVVQDAFRPMVDAEWMDSETVQTLNNDFLAILNAGDWKQAEEFLKTQQGRLAQLQMYGKRCRQAETSCRDAVAHGCWTQRAADALSAASAKLMRQCDWGALDAHFARVQSVVSLRAAVQESMQHLAATRDALLERHLDGIDAVEWAVLEAAWRQLPAVAEEQDGGVEALKNIVAALAERYGRYEVAAQERLADMRRAFENALSSFDRELQDALQQNRVDSADKIRYADARHACEQSWQRGKWAESVRQLSELRDGLRGKGLTAVTVQLSDGVSMKLLPLQPGRYEKTYVIHRLWPFSDEQKVQMVHLRDKFWLGEAEVSRGQYWGLLERYPEQYEQLRAEESWRRVVPPLELAKRVSSADADLPIVDVTWEQASLWCELLTAVEKAGGRLAVGYVYRLPSETEWEYAARLGRSSSQKMTVEEQGDAVCGGEFPQAVASGRPNGWQFYHTCGNVREWCLDVYKRDVFNDVSLMQMTPGFDTLKRVVKGGSFRSARESLDIRVREYAPSAYFVKAVQNNEHPWDYSGQVSVKMGSSDDATGFRIVLAPAIR